MQTEKISTLDILAQPDRDFIGSLGYDETYKKFEWKVPEYFNWALDVIDKWADDKDKLAMIWLDGEGSEKRLTFRDFKERSNRFANVFEGLGLRKGDRLLLMLPNMPELWDVELGCIKKGVVYMPATPLLTQNDIKFRLQTSQAKAVVTDSDNAEKFDEVRKECPSVKAYILADGEKQGWIDGRKAAAGASPDFTPRERTKADDPHLIYFTSGTTGKPKMVLHTNASYPMGHVITGRLWINMRPGDLHWNISSPGWAKHAWSNVYGPWNAGAAIFIYDHPGRFDPKRHLELLERYPITTFCTVPTVWRMFVQEDLGGYKFGSLRETVSAGEPLNPDTLDKWKEHTGLTIREGYGQTETVCLLANFPGVKVKPGSFGKPSPGFHIAIVDENGRELPDGTEGEIAVKVKPARPVGILKEYLNDPERTKQIFRGDWLLTGDVGKRDADGYFWFIGRAGDVIKWSGYRIGAFEVESDLVEHRAVKEVAVVGSPDPEGRGETVKAYIILKDGFEPNEATAQDIVRFMKAKTAPYKYPRKIEFVKELPKTISNKIIRKELRELEKRRFGDRSVQPLGIEFTM